MQRRWLKRLLLQRLLAAEACCCCRALQVALQPGCTRVHIGRKRGSVGSGAGHGGSSQAAGEVGGCFGDLQRGSMEVPEARQARQLCRGVRPHAAASCAGAARAGKAAEVWRLLCWQRQSEGCMAIRNSRWRHICCEVLDAILCLSVCRIVTNHQTADSSPMDCSITGAACHADKFMPANACNLHAPHALQGCVRACTAYRILCYTTAM